VIQIHQGVDIVDVRKFREITLRNKQFIPDIFTQKEQGYCLSRKDPYVHFAGRFAAKEACMKALGWGLSITGIDNMLLEIEIAQQPSGQPLLFLSGWALKIGQKKRIHQYTVSISHAGHTAIAMVILVGTEGQKP
jgi:holo-[acyl-carrier protein] synthase